ncbi:MAG TPA: aminoglycoside phosphotransferase family protein [Symbiobacteriaceae bacterium]|nr:aminoglycoside phosphotransferase family protein [Symbiobacteriaceae bacterium]
MQELLERLFPGLAPALEPIGGGKSGASICWVRRPGEPPLVLKVLRPGDIPVHLREGHGAFEAAEYRFYTELLPKLGVPAPQIHAAGRLDDGGTYLLMEDLTVAHRLLPEGHVWSEEELRSILALYAQLHGRSLRLFAAEPIPDWLQPDPRHEYRPQMVLDCLTELAANDWTREPAARLLAAPGLPALLERVAADLAALPPGLLYNDFYPGNVAIPKAGGPAKLYDWQLAGSGPIAVDLCNIGLLEGGAAFAAVDSAPLLEFYLDELARETGARIPTADFRADVHTASLLNQAVFLPFIVRAMRRCNVGGRQFSEWMAESYDACIRVFTEALG